jgi:CRISPR-associated protein Cas1
MNVFLDDFGIFLGRKRNRFIVKKNNEAKEIVADDVESIICCSSGVAFSASALDLAVENNIQVVFARYRGWPYAILMPASMTGSVRARREQFLAYNDDRSVVLAKKFIAGKLVNQANFLKLWRKTGVKPIRVWLNGFTSLASWLTRQMSELAESKVTTSMKNVSSL